VPGPPRPPKFFSCCGGRLEQHKQDCTRRTGVAAVSPSPELLGNCHVKVDFRDGRVSLILYPQDWETAILISRLYLVLEEVDLGEELNVGGCGPAWPSDEGDRPLEMMDIEIEPLNDKGKSELAKYANRPMPLEPAAAPAVSPEPPPKEPTGYGRLIGQGLVCGHPDCPCTGGYYHQPAPASSGVAPQKENGMDVLETLKEITQSLRRMSTKEAPIDIVQAACDSLASRGEAAIAKAEAVND
jgi:hypothetical protein